MDNNDLEQNLIQNNNTTEKDQFTLTWEKISLSISKKAICGPSSSFNILEDVSGFAKSGECLAILGASGSGKSTLLNILSKKLNKTSNMTYSGSVKLNQQEMSWNKFKNFIGFVMQRDLFFENLTVQEVFDFIGALRPQQKGKKDQVDPTTVVDDLNLEPACNTFVGGKFRKGISGGEKRRLSLGAELLANPRILFLDEPTSGLDSYTGYLVIRKLRKLARAQNMLIVYTIHQPSFEIYDLFDSLMILNKGKVSYFGKKEAAVDYYGSLGFSCPPRKLPVDYFLEVAIKGGEEADDIFEKSYKEKIQPTITDAINNVQKQPIVFKNKKAGICVQFVQLTKRAYLNFTRSLMAFKIRFFQMIFVAILFALLYGRFGDVDPGDPIGIGNRFGAYFFIISGIFNVFFQFCLLICRIKSPR